MYANYTDVPENWGLKEYGIYSTQCLNCVGTVAEVLESTSCCVEELCYLIIKQSSDINVVDDRAATEDPRLPKPFHEPQQSLPRHRKWSSTAIIDDEVDG